MRTKRLGFFMLFLSLASVLTAQYKYAYSQFTISVNAASVIRITPDTPVQLYMNPTAAGSAVSNTSNSTSYLKVTSIVASGSTKKIEVSISSGSVAPGTLLKLVASPCTSGSGTFGTVQSQITLQKDANLKLIDGIGSCYTGANATNGYNLTYTWELDPINQAELTAHTTRAIFITYTISSN